MICPTCKGVVKGKVKANSNIVAKVLRFRAFLVTFSNCWHFLTIAVSNESTIRILAVYMYDL